MANINYYDIFLDFIKAYAMQSDWENVLVGYRHLISLDDKTQAFFDQFATLEILQSIQFAYESKNDLGNAVDFVDRQIDLIIKTQQVTPQKQL